MKGWAAKGMCTMGWFYGFKLHLVINDKAEIIQWQLTPGNVDDRAPLKDSRSIDNFATNLFAGLIAYNLLPKKPEMTLEIIDRSRLIA